MTLRRWRIAIILLCISALCITVFGQDSLQPDQADSDTHYVIITDLTGEGDSVEICRTLTTVITDLLPLENVRISLFAYGYKDTQNGAFPFSEGTKAPEKEYIHEIQPPYDCSKDNFEEYCDALVQALCGITVNSGRKSPHGQALLAAMQHLEDISTPDKKARVIFISDGELASLNPTNDNICKDKALEIAQRHQWPIYTIELDQNHSHIQLPQSTDYDSINFKEVNRSQYPRALMTEVSWKSGARRTDAYSNAASLPGTWVIGSSTDNADVPTETLHRDQSHLSALEILGFQTEENTIDPNGTLEIPITVANLTCEYLIYLQNTSPDDVTVLSASAAEPINSAMLLKTDGGSYSVIRLFCPTPGRYTLRVEGTPNTKILIGRKSVVNPQPKLTFRDGTQHPLDHDKDGSLLLPEGSYLSVDAEFWYGEKLLEISTDDTSYTAKLELALDTQNHTNNSTKDLSTEIMTPCETKWICENLSLDSYLDDCSISPKENTGIYLIRFQLSSPDADPLLCRDYRLVSDPSSDTNVPDEKLIDLGDITAFQSVTISLDGKLDDMPTGSLEFSLIGQDHSGAPFYLLDHEEQPQTTVITKGSLLKLKTTGCIGEYEIGLHVSAYKASDDFTLKFNIIEPVPDTNDTYPVLYYKNPSKLFWWMNAKPDEEEYSRSWGDSVKPISVDYDEQFLDCDINYDTERGYTVTIKPKATGKGDVTVTLDTGTFRVDPDGNRQENTKYATIHAEVKSLTVKKLLSCLVGLVVIIFSIVCFQTYITKNCEVQCIFGRFSDDDTRDIKLVKKTKIKELLDENFIPSQPESNSNPTTGEVAKTKEKIGQITLIPLRFPKAPILITNIPNYFTEEIGDKTYTRKRILLLKEGQKITFNNTVSLTPTKPKPPQS